MSGFTEQIAPVNQLAEKADGFVWRYAEAYKPRETVAPWNNPLLFFNMSVWRDLDSLLNFVRSPEHIAVTQNRDQWILPVGTPSLALWWTDGTNVPTVENAIDAFSLIANKGDTPAAFSPNSSVALQMPNPHDKS